MPKELIITKPQFKEIIAVILKANPAARICLDEFRHRLIGMLVAVGVCDDHSVYTKAFREYAANQPDHADLAREFRAIAAAEDPLAPSVCSRMARSELNNAARRKWFRRKMDRSYPLQGVTFELLTEAEQAEVRQMATGLADFHKSQVQAHRPNKETLNTILEGLGDLYASITAFDGHRHDLPHAEKSQFVQFCRLVLVPFFDPSEVTERAISRRWKRTKDRSRRPKWFAKKQRRSRR